MTREPEKVWVVEEWSNRWGWRALLADSSRDGAWELRRDYDKREKEMNLSPLKRRVVPYFSPSPTPQEKPVASKATD